MAKRSKNSGDEGASLLRTYCIAFLLVNYILWGIAVSIYQGGSGLELEGGLTARPRRGGAILIFVMAIVVFITSSFTALPNIGSVIPYIWDERKWFVAVVGIVNALLFLFIAWMKKVEQDLNSGHAFKKRKR